MAFRVPGEFPSEGAFSSTSSLPPQSSEPGPALQVCQGGNCTRNAVDNSDLCKFCHVMLQELKDSSRARQERKLGKKPANQAQTATCKTCADLNCEEGACFCLDEPALPNPLDGTLIDNVDIDDDECKTCFQIPCRCGDLFNAEQLAELVANGKSKYVPPPASKQAPSSNSLDDEKWEKVSIGSDSSSDLPILQDEGWELVP